jgi:nicotinate phosphoribosyltransferase
MVYKLVEVDGRPVAKRSEHKQTAGGRKRAFRSCKPTGTVLEEIVVTGGSDDPAGARPLQRPLVRGGVPVDGALSLEDARARLRQALVALPWEGLKLSRGEPAIPTRTVGG